VVLQEKVALMKDKAKVIAVSVYIVALLALFNIPAGCLGFTLGEENDAYLYTAITNLMMFIILWRIFKRKALILYALFSFGLIAGLYCLKTPLGVIYFLHFSFWVAIVFLIVKLYRIDRQRRSRS
jgi:hypothetical protein